MQVGSFHEFRYAKPLWTARSAICPGAIAPNGTSGSNSPISSTFSLEPGRWPSIGPCCMPPGAMSDGAFRPFADGARTTGFAFAGAVPADGDRSAGFCFPGAATAMLASVSIIASNAAPVAPRGKSFLTGITPPS